jgi:hypothetical protein
MEAFSDEPVLGFVAAITAYDVDAALDVCDSEVEFRVEIEMTTHARGRESGAPIAAFAAHSWTLRNGKLLRNEPFRELEPAVRAAGSGE